MLETVQRLNELLDFHDILPCCRNWRSCTV